MKTHLPALLATSALAAAAVAGCQSDDDVNAVPPVAGADGSYGDYDGVGGTVSGDGTPTGLEPRDPAPPPSLEQQARDTGPIVQNRESVDDAPDRPERFPNRDADDPGLTPRGVLPVGDGTNSTGTRIGDPVVDDDVLND